MEIQIEAGDKAQHDTILRNLYQFYLYEFSRFGEAWRVEADGRFEESDLEGCWEDDHRRIFLIRVDQALAGFAICDLNLPDTDGSTVHEVSEFFVMPPYQKQGVGEYAARWLFDQFRGRWEIAIVDSNVGALHFWRRVLGRYTSFREAHRPEEDDYLLTFERE